VPELPEVETIVRELNQASLAGKKVTEVIVNWARSIAQPASHVFCQNLKNQIIQYISRRGKYIVFGLNQSHLLVHLRMTGKFLILPEDNQIISTHERVRLYLSDGRVLIYEDQRKFGKWYLVKDQNSIFDKLGLEPLSSSFTLKAFHPLLKKHHKQIKPFLLDQRYVAGLGNIYVDEALWEAKIHPMRLTHTLSATEISALHRAIKAVLKKGIKNTGTTLGSHRANYFSVSGRRGENQHQLNVFRREGLPCPSCKSTLIKIVVGQRGTHLCPQCQR
jgi:formamidopyrimidine-DNA glycosylase